MREIIFDTETTGLDRKKDRVVEIGCVEIVDMVPTGRTFHQYCNPLMPVSREAYRIHGLSDVFLATKPTFKRIHNRFLSFIEGARLVAHNATFDISMINEELDRLGIAPLENEVVDTLAMAREVHPRRKHTLDALCSIYNIDTSRRTEHGALLDSELLAQVYVEMRGGLQIGMQLDLLAGAAEEEEVKPARQRPTPLASRLTNEDIAAHRAFVETLGEKAIWREYV
ncbi:DNA polymerase III subunit epsilon [Bradyrhizobium hipponense]|uniref:DNA polymerase III subunit epsilon n=1 Tax=Bradyrhizobium hipponense TaxID=2605638 RepID=A0A5S4YLZ7_9BRAD|nr:DNA polymerase III subunit epsilon [Bradyrhizobium hipponense]TYO65426.1 DNA polymerase III subunit epsilon [Bradyrhizobium hipponense]